MSDLKRDMCLAMREVLGNGYVPDYYESEASEFIDIAERYIAEERERCAKIAESHYKPGRAHMPVVIAQEIRKGGTQ